MILEKSDETSEVGPRVFSIVLCTMATYAISVRHARLTLQGI